MPEFPPAAGLDPTVWTNARAVAIDELLAANLPADVAAIPTTYQFSEYLYAAALANNTNFTPPSGTIVFAATLGVITGATQIRYRDTNGMIFVSNTDASPGAHQTGIFGGMYCDGTRLHYRNTQGAQQTLYLFGLSMA